MTIAEVLLGDFNFEMSNTRRTLERIPEDKPEFRADPKSMPMGRLAMHCATLPLFGSYILEDDGMDMKAPKRAQASLVYTSREDCLKQLEENAARCREVLASTTDEQMAAKWRFSFGDMVISDLPRSLTFRVMFINHLIHHVAQLGIYLRLNGVPVPALYGPSADEQWVGI
jgi:uncharacterized damage-inducible protein DinB